VGRVSEVTLARKAVAAFLLATLVLLIPQAHAQMGTCRNCGDTKNGCNKDDQGNVIDAALQVSKCLTAPQNSDDIPDDVKCYASMSFAWYKTWVSCAQCTPRIRCSDYDNQAPCDSDPCRPGADARCNWVPKLGGFAGICSRDCGDGSSEADCIAHECLWKRKWFEFNPQGTGFECVACHRDAKCGDYNGLWDSCHANPCNVPANCIYFIDKCTVDSDGDGVPDDFDNCPLFKNRDQKNRYCDEQNECDEGDVCDDTDGDGLTDAQEELIDGISPLDFDSDDNCMSDGVEFALDPVINILKRLGAGVVVLMVIFVGVKWVTAEGPKERAGAKAAMVYIFLGLLMFMGGKELILFIFAENCDGQFPPLAIGEYYGCPDNGGLQPGDDGFEKNCRFNMPKITTPQTTTTTTITTT